MMQAMIEWVAVLYLLEKAWRFMDLLKRTQVRAESGNLRAEANAVDTKELLAKHGLSSKQMGC